MASNDALGPPRRNLETGHAPGGNGAKTTSTRLQVFVEGGIGVDTLQNWEQGRRQPTVAARVLLRVAAKHPEVVLEAVA